MTAPHAGTPAVDVPIRHWGDFPLLEVIGHGGFGTVYRAYHPRLQCEVALKLVRVTSERPREVEKALDEARRLAQVRDPHVVTVHDALFFDGHVGICMELVRGQTLAELVHRRGVLGPDETVAWGATLCRALAAIHRTGLVHNDVKAHNVVREHGGRIVLMDFGAGRRLHDPDRTTGLHLVGTPAYMAPEVLKLKDPTPLSDIYSLGVLLFFVLTGDYPVPGSSIGELASAHSRRARRYIPDLRDNVPTHLVAVVERALQPDPRDRYQSAGEMLADLTTTGQRRRRAVEAPARPTPPPPVWRPGVARRRMHATAVFIAWATPVVWLLGFLQWKAHAAMFGLSREFVTASPLEWLLSGLRTLVLPFFFMVVVILAYDVARMGCRVAVRLSPGVAAWSQRCRERASTAVIRAGLADSTAAASAVLLAQVIAFLLVYATFQDLLTAFTTPIAAGARPEHQRLAPSNENEWLLYRTVTSVLTFASAAAWAVVISGRRAGEGGFARIASGLLLTALFAGMFTIPWRLYRHSTFELAAVGRERCFVVGIKQPDVLVLCPYSADAPRLQLNQNDPRLTRSLGFANIFAAARSGASPREGQ